MKSYVRGLVLLSSVLAVVLLGGAGSSTASTSVPQCNNPAPTGRQFCVVVEDTDNVSPSGPVGSGPRQENVTAYQYYKFTVTNTAGSTLTNGTLSVVLTDNFLDRSTNPPTVPRPPASSTALFIPSGSSPGCTVVSTTSPNRVDCVLGNLAANATGPTFTLAYRTSTSVNVDSTDAAWTVGFKEGLNPNGANPSSYSATENTSLEPNPEHSQSWTPISQPTSLGTSPTTDSQFSVLAFKVPTGNPFFSTLDESSGNLCDGVHSCFGELVTAHVPAATGTFSSSNPLHLTITLVPADFGANVGNPTSIVIIHQTDGGTIEPAITRQCVGDPLTVPQTLPCIHATKVNPPGNAPKLLVVDFYGLSNGGFRIGS